MAAIGSDGSGADGSRPDERRGNSSRANVVPHDEGKGRRSTAGAALSHTSDKVETPTRPDREPRFELYEFYDPRERGLRRETVWWIGLAGFLMGIAGGLAFVFAAGGLA